MAPCAPGCRDSLRGPRGGQRDDASACALARFALDLPAFVTLFVAGGIALVGLIAHSYVVWRSDPDRETFGR